MPKINKNKKIKFTLDPIIKASPPSYQRVASTLFAVKTGQAIHALATPKYSAAPSFDKLTEFNVKGIGGAATSMGAAALAFLMPYFNKLVDGISLWRAEREVKALNKLAVVNYQSKKKSRRC